jgi:hypothetical protein
MIVPQIGSLPISYRPDVENTALISTKIGTMPILVADLQEGAGGSLRSQR